MTTAQTGFAPPSMPPADAIVFTRNLTKTYGLLVAVHDVNMTVERGTITGIVGPNGAGKTTTFLMLATLLEPAHGEAWVCGHDAVRNPVAVRAKMGYMPDFFGIYDDVRCDEYLDFFAACYGVESAKRPQLVEDLLALVDLTGKTDAFVNSLSRGMKQRLCLARALVHDPELLILDEPASGLDPRARIELRGLLTELRDMGKTILISSHILSELEEVCSHVVIMEAGRVAVQGRSSEIAAGLSVTRRFRIRIAGDDQAALLAALQGRTHVLTAEPAGADVDAEIAGGDAEAAEVLAGLVRDGHSVVGFSEVATGLEEIFMKVTKGIVQ